MVGSTNFFEINLHDGDGNILLGIDEGNTGQKLVFDIVNTSGKDIMLNALDLATAENNNKYHFSFAFRPGTISSNAFNTITLKVFINSSEPNDASFGNGDQWEFKRDDKTQSFYLVSKIEKVFPVNKTITFVLEKISASPDGGARGTRVEIKYDNLKFGDTVLTGNCLKNLNILNQRGKKQVPLYVGFIGSNTILNDGSENTLTLSIQLLPRLESSLAAKCLVVNSSSDEHSSNLPTIKISEIENYIKEDFNTQQLISNQITLSKYIDFKRILLSVFGNNIVVQLLLSNLINIFDSSADYSVKYRSLKTFLVNPTVKNLLPGLNQLFVDNLLDDFLQKLNEVQSNVVSQEDIATLLFLLKDLGLPDQNLTKLQGLNIIDKIVDNIERSLSSQVVPLKELDEAVKFTISFDVATAENNQWALVSQNEADNIRPEIIRPEIAKDSPHPEKWIYGGLQKQGITPQWSFICTKGLNLEKPSEILRLSISNIKTTLLAGYANLYVHYENIPGYWDGHITVPIQKGPLVYREKEISVGKDSTGQDQTVKVACVGIGTDKPQAKLHIKKDANLPLALNVEGDVKIAGKLAINDYLSNNDNYVQLNTAGDYKYKSGIKLRVFNDFFGFTIEYDDRLDGQKKQGLNVLRHENSTDGISAVFIERTTGNIGIGIDKPQAKLHIKKDSSSPLALSVEGDTTIEGNLLVKNGNVGIGVTDPNMQNMTRTLAIDKGSKGIYGIAQERNNSDNNGWRMSLITEGTKRMTIMHNGNVGIGTDYPRISLDVIGQIGCKNNNGIHDHLYLHHDGSTAYISAGGADNGLVLRVGREGGDSYGTQNYNEVMRLHPNGNIIMRSSLLELLQTENVPPSIRFHHSGNWWRRMHADSNGFHFKDGGSDSYCTVNTGNLNVKGSLQVTDMPYGDKKNVQWDEGSKQFYQDNSSRKSKENITILDDKFSQIMQVEPKTYTRPGSPSIWEIGYIAEEFHELGLGNLIYYEKDGSPGAIHYDKISIYLLEIIKELCQKINQIEQRLT
jgi:hypothetical protein